MFLSLALILGLQAPDPALTDWQAAVTAAQAENDTEATVGRLTGTDDRVVLCALSGAFTRLAVLPQHADHRQRRRETRRAQRAERTTTARRWPIS